MRERMCHKVSGAAVTIRTLRLWRLMTQNQQTVKRQENILPPKTNIYR